MTHLNSEIRLGICTPGTFAIFFAIVYASVSLVVSKWETKSTKLIARIRSNFTAANYRGRPIEPKALQRDSMSLRPLKNDIGSLGATRPQTAQEFMSQIASNLVLSLSL